MTDLPLPEHRDLPLQARLPVGTPDYTRILAAHATALARGDEGYLDPATGYFTFTAAALWERGWCCDSGCRHCPFQDGARGPEGVVPDQLEPGTW